MIRFFIREEAKLFPFLVLAAKSLNIYTPFLVVNSKLSQYKRQISLSL